MNTRILNRSGGLPADNWYQIEVSGEHPNKEAGVIQIIDAKAIDSIVNRFAARAAAAGDDWSGLLIDRDHFSLDPDKTTEAYGWLMEVRNRDGQLEGRIDWTDLGRPAVEAKRFKFFSSVYDRADVEKLGTRQVRNRAWTVIRPLALDRLAVTNDPNNKGGKPISNRDSGDESQPIMKNLLKKLGLAEDASEESGLAALEKITNRAATAEASLATVTAERDTLLDTQIEADLEKHKGVIKNRDTIKAALKRDRKGTLEMLEGLQPAGDGGEGGERSPITNRRQAKTPSKTPAEADASQEADARAARISNRAKQLRAGNPSLSLGQAYADAEAEEATGKK